MLAETIGPRNTRSPQALAAAAEYIDASLRQAGYAPTEQGFMADQQAVRNILIEIPGQAAPDEILVIGAHYDTVDLSPGANDNGSGVACLLEMARAWAGQSFHRTLRLVAFVNEEPPWFQGRFMGSEVYAQAARQRGDPILGMLALETIGCYLDTPNSQQYPLPLPGYPHQGNFIGLISNPASISWLDALAAAFRRHSAFPMQALAAPEEIAGVGWSDHAAFWRAGFPAAMASDTAPFRYAHYHTAQDTPDKIDYPRLAQASTDLAAAVADLANQPGWPAWS